MCGIKDEQYKNKWPKATELKLAYMINVKGVEGKGGIFPLN